MADKVVVANRSALKAKYGAGGLSDVTAAVNALIAADKARGLKTQCVWIDDAKAMKSFGGVPPVNAKDERGNKKAVDAIAAKLSPDYIVLLDGPDVIPHIELDNPAPGDGDNNVESDLPYASPGAYAKQTARFLNVTRVVGRIPNVPGAKDPSRLVKYIENAAKAASVPQSKLLDYFGLSAAVWQASTQMSLNAAFDNSTHLATAPPDLPPATDPQLKKPSHFINCHGANIDPNFYGQSGEDYPVALTSAQVLGNVAKGTVAAAECCYGAQLYDPVLAGVAEPICVAYLDAGGLGFLGSTNIAYGPADSNRQADLMTQYFFEGVLGGASLGRSLLQARQKFIVGQKMTDPTNLKTLAQFLLLGDPSVTPCVAASGAPASHGLRRTEELADAFAQRKARRVRLESVGSSLAAGKATAAGAGAASAAARRRVREAAASRGFTGYRESIFAIRPGTGYRLALKERSIQESVMMITEKPPAPSHIVSVRHLVAHIIGNGIASIEETVSR